MINFIAAIDSKRGIANEKGIPWDLPSDRKYYREMTKGQAILMGYGTYKEFDSAWSDRYNYVAARQDTLLKPGFNLVDNVDLFIENFEGNLWIVGGAKLFTSTIKYADKLYLTQLDKDYKCTKFFPEFKNDFKLVDESPQQTENNINFTFQTWGRVT